MVKNRLVREPERRAITGLSRTHWWRLEGQGVVPRRRQIGMNSVGWSLRELLEWIDSRPVVGASDEASDDRQTSR